MRDPSATAFLAYTPYLVARKTCTDSPASTSIASAATSTMSEPSQTDTAQSEAQRIPGGELLSLGLDELGERLGGSGRAKMVWSAIADGVDPFSEKGSVEFLTPRTAQQLKATAERLPWQV